MTSTALLRHRSRRTRLSNLPRRLPVSRVIILAISLVIISVFCILVVRIAWLSPKSVGVVLRNSRVSNVVPKNPFDHILSACVIVRDSSDIIGEFIVRNYLAGVDHFFVYGDDDNPLEISRLSSMFSAFSGLVTYLPNGRAAPNDEEDAQNYVQMRMYRHCLKEFGNSSQWMALIDTDEFFEPSSASVSNEESTLRSPVAFMHEVLEAHSSLPVLCVRWRTALTNGRLREMRPGQILDDLFPSTCEVQVNNKEKLALRKTILQPRFLDFDASPKLDVAIHKGFRFLREKEKYQCIWGLGHILEPAVHLVHYWSRDLSSYLRKIKRGRPRKGVPARSLTDLFSRESLCEPEGSAAPRTYRNAVLRRLMRRLPFFSPLPKSLPGWRQAVGIEQNNSTFSFCYKHVAELLSELEHGREFSNQRFCLTQNSLACSPRKAGSWNSWPFPWAEYMMSCEITMGNSMYI